MFYVHMAPHVHVHYNERFKSLRNVADLLLTAESEANFSLVLLL